MIKVLQKTILGIINSEFGKFKRKSEKMLSNSNVPGVKKLLAL